MEKSELNDEEYLGLKRKLFALQMKKTLQIKNLSEKELVDLREEIETVKKAIAKTLFSIKEKEKEKLDTLEGGLKK